MDFINNPALNIIVVGFHHRKGCQVEFCYPELVEGSSTELPPAWKHLPALALPDGSHNFTSGTIFFHLPSLVDAERTAYAISCFRQMSVEHVMQRTSDMTRNTVQKSVVVVCKEPLFGRISIKMELVVQTWFVKGDFNDTQLLKELLNNLNSCPIHVDQMLEGLSVEKFLEKWRHKTVLLFKLLLLQKKIVMYGPRASDVTLSLLTMVSLLPQAIHKGLTHSANIVPARASSQPKTDEEIKQDEVDEGIEATSINKTLTCDLSPKECDDTVLEPTDRQKCNSISDKSRNTKLLENSLPRDVSMESLNSLVHRLRVEDFELEIFKNGHLCLPYLCLQYLDILSDPGVHGFLVGASNVLFKQKRQLFDILIESEDMRIETSDLSLKRQLQLTTEDLRFADHIVRHGVSMGDAWIREQLMSYMAYMLRTSLLPDGSREIDSYNSLYMSALKSTEMYTRWLNTSDNGGHLVDTIPPGHLFGGQLSVADMKLRIAHTMSSTEGGRRVTAAVVSTSRAVGGAIATAGGAITAARGALAGWWTNITANQPAQLGNQSNSESPQSDDVTIATEDIKVNCSDAEEATENKDNRSNLIENNMTSVNGIHSDDVLNSLRSQGNIEVV